MNLEPHTDYEGEAWQVVLTLKALVDKIDRDQSCSWTDAEFEQARELLKGYDV